MRLDGRLRIAIGLAVLEWLVIGGLVVLGAKDQFPLVITILTVASGLQMATLFWRGRDNSPYGQAQRAFVAGRYPEVIQQLAGSQDFRSLTLIGNAYRMQGQLDESEQALATAVQQQPDDPFPRYGLGRTLLAQGRYSEAIPHLEQALAQGGRKATRAELALAYYLNGDVEAAQQAAKQASRHLQMEPYRVLMVNYLRHQLEQDPAAPGFMQRASNGLAYWQAEANRFASTGYGNQLQQEVAQMSALLK